MRREKERKKNGETIRDRWIRKRERVDGEVQGRREIIWCAVSPSPPQALLLLDAEERFR